MEIMDTGNFISDELPVCPQCRKSKMEIIHSETISPPSGSNYGGTALYGSKDEFPNYRIWKEYKCPLCGFSYEDYE